MSARSALAIVGGATRHRLSFTLQLGALLWGVVSEGVRPAVWRRTLRSGFRASLTRLVGGSLGTVAVMALVVGLGLVFEALYWLHTAGQDDQIGPLLVLVLVREVAPLLVGVILLGRGGTAIIADLGLLKIEGEVAILRAEGFDLFDYLVLPRAASFAVASFTLGILFILVALFSGFVAGSVAGVTTGSFVTLLDTLLRTMSWRDFMVLPAKLLSTGIVVALVACATGLGAHDSDVAGTLLSRGFTRGMSAVLAVSLLLSALL